MGYDGMSIIYFGQPCRDYSTGSYEYCVGKEVGILCSVTFCYFHVFFMHSWSSRAVGNTQMLRAAFMLHKINGIEQCYFVFTLALCVKY